MDQLPIFIDVRQQSCLVVGGGHIAARKVEMLLKAGAKVHVVATNLCATLQEKHQENEIEFIDAPFEEIHAQQDYRLIFAATSQQKINNQVADIANRKNIPVNVVDQPKLCSFIMPAIIERDPMIIAISSGGKSPSLARLLRARLEVLLPPTYGKLAILLGLFRQQVKVRLSSVKERRQFWASLLDGKIINKILSETHSAAETERLLHQALNEAVSSPQDISKTGMVNLINVTQDIDALTLRALRAMQMADAVFYDALIPHEITNLFRRDAEQISFNGQQKQSLQKTAGRLVEEVKKAEITYISLLVGSESSAALLTSLLEDQGVAVNAVV